MNQRNCQNEDGNPAVCVCPCSDPPSRYCLSCFSAHGLSHHPLPTPEEPEERMTCTECSSREALQFCICRDVLPSICSECEGRHLMKNKRALHWMINHSNRARLKDRAFIESVRKKIVNIHSAETKKNQNLDKVSQCKELIHTHFLQVKSAMERRLEDEKNESLQSLQVIESLLDEEFTIALQTMEDHLLDENYLPERPVSRAAFLHSYLDDRDALDFFDFEKGRVGVDCDPALGVVWECRVQGDRTISNAWLKVGAKQIAMVRTSNISYYVPATGRKTTVPLSTPIANPNPTPWLFLPNGDVFLSGFYNGGISTTQTTIIKPTGQVVHVANLQTARHGSGLAYFNGWVYCFGGHNGALIASCEKYSIIDNSWSPMAAMNTPRCHFNPCEYKKILYIFGGNSTACEMFSLIGETFIQMEFKVPEAGNCASILIEDEILIFTKSCVTRFNVRNKQFSSQVPSVGDICIRFSPVIIGKIAYVIHTPHASGLDGVRPLDLNTFAFKNTISLA